MEYSKLVAVTGIPGLHELISSKNDGAIVRSLEDNSTRFASSRIHNFSHLESIEVYTTGENVNLVEIFHAMEKGDGALPDGKDNAAVKQYFETVYPDLDFERVYASDLKKMLKWFEVLKKNKIEIKLSEVPEEQEEEAAEEPAPAPEEKKKPKAAAKEPKADSGKKAAAGEEKPVKEKTVKAAAKKEAATEEPAEAKKPAKKAAPKKK